MLLPVLYRRGSYGDCQDPLLYLPSNLCRGARRGIGSGGEIEVADRPLDAMSEHIYKNWKIALSPIQ